MITAIRRQFKGESLKYVVWVILATLAIGTLVPMFLREGKGGGWALRINGEEISDMEFAHQAAQEQERIARIREQYGQYADLLFQSQGLSLDPRSLAYEYLVQQELINQVGNALGLYISSEYISQKVSDPMFVMREQSLAGLIPAYAFDQVGGINKEVLQAHLRRHGVTTAQFERYVERALVRRLVLEILGSTTYVPTFDVMQRYIAQYVGKKYSIVTVSLDSLIDQEKKTPVNDMELEQFFNLENTKNRRYWVPEKRSGVIWTFKSDAYGAQPSQEAIEAYYEKNRVKDYLDEPVKVQVRRIVLPVKTEAERESVRAQAETLRQELVAHPDQFAKTAKLVPFFARGESKLSSAFEKAAFTLAQDGDISPVVEGDEGFELVQRVERRPRTFKPLSAVKQEIKNAIAQRKFQEAFIDDMKRVTRGSESSQEAFEALAKAKGATSHKLDAVTKDSSADAQKLFGLRKDGISFTVEKSTGSAVQLIEVNPAYAPTLAAVRTQVLNDLYEHRARKKLAALLEDSKRKASSHSTQELVAMTHGALEKTDWLSSTQNERVAALEKKEVPVSIMLQMEKAGSTMTFEGDSAGFIIRLEEIQPVDKAEFAAKEAAVRKPLEQERGQAAMLGFVASLARNARIEINETLMQHLS